MNDVMFPHAVDSTMLDTFRSCPHKFWRSYVQHWKPQSESVHLVAGGAFAKGIEVARKEFFERGRPPAECVGAGLEALMRKYGDFECPDDSAKSLIRMCGALEFYFDNYPLGDDGLVPLEFADGRKAIEFSFAEPTDIPHPVTGDPILYTGRLDLLGEFANGQYCVDEKTTKSLGQSWPRQWEMRGQFTAYQWAAGRAGINCQGTIVRGISILKTKYETMQVITNRSPYELDRWYAQTLRDIQRMIQCWREGYWDFALGNACNDYGGCGMTRICKSQDPNTWLPMYFTKRVWDPLARQELTVEEWERSWGHEPGTGHEREIEQPAQDEPIYLP